MADIPQGYTLDAPSSAPPENAQKSNYIPDIPEGYTLDSENPINTAKATISGFETGIPIIGPLAVKAQTALSQFLPKEYQTTEADVKKLAEDHPVANTIGNIIGGGAGFAATGGLGAVAEGASVLAKGAALAGEGSIFGANNAEQEALQGDYDNLAPDLIAQKVLTHMAGGALGAVALGSVAKLGEMAIPAAMRGTSRLASAIKNVFEHAPEAEKTIAEEINPGDLVAPKTAQDVKDIVKKAGYMGLKEELPQMQKLTTAIAESPPSVPFAEGQINAYKSLDDLNNYKTQRLTSPDLQRLEAVQKQGLNNSIDATISKVAPEGREVIADADKNGELAADIFNKQLKEEQQSAGKLIEEAKKIKTEGVDNLVGAINEMTKKVPAIGDLVAYNAEGKMEMKPWSSDIDITKQAYSKFKDAFEALQKNPQDFSKLFAIRNNMGAIESIADSSTKNQVMRMKSALMDYMGNLTEGGAAELRDGFKRYAINEETRGTLEKNFGIDTKEIQAHKVGKADENITNKIFKNSETVSAAKQILPKDDFDHITANYLAQMRQKYTNSEGVFSSKNFDKFLSDKSAVLNEALSENTKLLNDLKNYTLQSRIVPDASSINPSGTAITGFKMLKQLTSPEGWAELAKELSIDKINEHIAKQNFNNMLQGKSGKATVYSEIHRMVGKVTDTIESKAKSIFNNNASRGIIVGATVKGLNSDYDKNVKKVQDFSSNPQNMMDNIASKTNDLYKVAPNITQGIHNAVIQSAGFLNSKIPKPVSELPLAGKWEPTQEQKNKFNRYYEAVNNPISVLQHVKDGTLNNESMEALQATQPHLLEEMQQKVMGNINPKTAAHLNYATKMSISKFLGQPLEEGMLPHVIASNQATFAMPAQRQDQARPNHGGMEKMHLSDRYKTRTERDPTKV